MSITTYDILFMLIPFGLMIIGYFLTFVPFYLPYVKKWQLAQMRKKRGDAFLQSALYRETAKLLELSYGKASSNMVYTFLFSIFALYLVTGGILTFQGFSIISSAVFALILPVIVFSYLYIRIYNNRVKVSYEGTEAFTELTNTYRIEHRNLPAAIERVVQELDGRTPLTRNLLINLLYRLRDAQNEKETRAAVDQMVLAIDTSWSRQLANLFKISLIRGDDITDGLLDVVRDLNKLDELGEQKKRENLESVIMIHILTPLLMIGSFIGFFTLFDFTFSKFINYQFQSAIGFKMFFFMIIGYSTTLLMYKILTRSKNDY